MLHNAETKVASRDILAIHQSSSRLNIEVDAVLHPVQSAFRKGSGHVLQDPPAHSTSDRQLSMLKILGIEGQATNMGDAKAMADGEVAAHG